MKILIVDSLDINNKELMTFLSKYACQGNIIYVINFTSERYMLHNNYLDNNIKMPKELINHFYFSINNSNAIFKYIRDTKKFDDSYDETSYAISGKRDNFYNFRYNLKAIINCLLNDYKSIALDDITIITTYVYMERNAKELDIKVIKISDISEGIDFYHSLGQKIGGISFNEDLREKIACKILNLKDKFLKSEVNTRIIKSPISFENSKSAYNNPNILFYDMDCDHSWSDTTEFHKTATSILYQFLKNNDIVAMIAYSYDGSCHNDRVAQLLKFIRLFFEKHHDIQDRNIFVLYHLLIPFIYNKKIYNNCNIASLGEGVDSMDIWKYEGENIPFIPIASSNKDIIIKKFLEYFSKSDILINNIYVVPNNEFQPISGQINDYDRTDIYKLKKGFNA